MAREDYLEIKQKFYDFAAAWQNGESEKLNDIFVPETACYLSTVEKYPCGSQHGIYGVKAFTKDHPEPDYFHIKPCNVVIRVAKDRAQQSAILVCHAGCIEGENVRSIEFDALTVNSWVKTEEGWKIDEFRMDITICDGDYKEFVDNWYFEHQDLKYYFGIHLPVISGELDSPWVRIPKEDEGKNDEELIQETFSRYAYGIDTLNFANLIESLSDDLVVNMAPWGAMDKREFMQTLKFKRQAGRYWCHPAQLDTISVKGNDAFMTLQRMAGHKQSNLPVVVDKDNYNKEYADARYEIKMKKENGTWKIFRMDYFLGTIELGEYDF